MAEKKTKAPAKKAEGPKSSGLPAVRSGSELGQAVRRDHSIRAFKALIQHDQKRSLARLLSALDRYALAWWHDNKYPLNELSLIQAVQAGLDLNCIPGTKGGGHLVPFRNPQTGLYDISWMPGYEVCAKIMQRLPNATWVDSELVYENDRLEETKGTTESLLHVPERNPARRGDLIGAYAVIRFADGTSRHKFLDLDDIARHRAASKNKSNWDANFPEFARKSCLISLMKFFWGLSEEVDQRFSKVIDLEYQGADPELIPKTYDARGKKTREIAGADMIQELAQSRDMTVEVEPEPIDFPDAVPEQAEEPRTTAEESEIKQKYLACLREMRKRKMATEDYEACPEEYLEDAIVDMEELLAKVEES